MPAQAPQPDLPWPPTWFAPGVQVESTRKPKIPTLEPRPQDINRRILILPKTIDGNLHVRECPRLRSIGDELEVRGDLVLGGGKVSHEGRRLPLRALPDHLHVTGSLEVHGCFLLERLPTDLSIGGSLVIADCDSLQSLPDGLLVPGSLTILGGRSLAALPQCLRVGGDFRLAGTRITELPADLNVRGSLTVEGRSRITHVPATIQVGGDINLRRCRIDSLPAGLRVGESLRLPGCRQMRSLPEGLNVPKNLILSDCTTLERLPSNLRVGKSLSLRNCTALTGLPDGLKVPEILDLRACTSLNSLPRALAVGADFAHTARRHRGMPIGTFVAPVLRLAGCTALTQLPDDLSVHGAIDLEGSAIRDVPPRPADIAIFWRRVVVPADVIFHPERLDPLRIFREQNTELRRIMMEQSGTASLLARAGAQTIDADTDAGGPRGLVHIPAINHRYLFCNCPSTGRQYLLRVPPAMRTCHQAAAWVAGFEDPSQYHPVQET